MHLQKITPTTLASLSIFGLSLFATTADARLYFYSSTDANGNFLPASFGGAIGTPATWTGSGIVQPNVSGAAATVINDFSGIGEFGNLSMARDGTFVDICVKLIPFDPNAAFSADISFDTFGGGPSGGAVDEYGGFSVLDFVNVKGFEYKLKLDTPIASRANNSNPQVPWGAGVKRGAGSDTYDVAATYGGLTTVNNISTTPNPLVPSDVQYGIPTGANPINMPNSGLMTNSGPAGSIVGTQTGITSGNWIGLHGVDYGSDGVVNASNGNNGVISGDAERAYMDMLTFNIMDSSGMALDRGTKFVFSMDGAQYRDTLANAINIPEPSRFLLLSLGGSLVLLRRRRS